jgi:AcrR family transcriptional regulator
MSAKSQKAAKGRGRPKGSNAESIVLTGAVQAFAEYGFHDCTVEKILAASGISRTNFYRFFKNKEQVFNAVLRQGFQGMDSVLVSAFRTAAELPGDEEKIDHVLTQYLHACFDSGPLVSVMNQREYTSPNFKHIRDASLETTRSHIARLMMDAGYSEPNPLILEGLLAAIDRVVVLVYQQERSAKRRFKVAHESIMPIISAMAGLFR